MKSGIILYFVIFHKVASQIDGQFWWLKDEYSKLKGIEPPPVKIEDVGEIGNDETDKVVFKDNNNRTSKSFEHQNKEADLSNKTSIVFHFKDNSIIGISNVTGNTNKNYSTKLFFGSEYNKSKDSKSDEDQFRFFFPENENGGMKYLDNKFLDLSKNEQNPSRKIENDLQFDKDSEPICVFVNKIDCNLRRGVVYGSEKTYHNGKFNKETVCCIVPLLGKDNSKIHFPQEQSTKSRRHKRSEIRKPSSILSNVLLNKKFATKRSQCSKKPEKIVTDYDEDYMDPYWNVRTKLGSYEDYVQDEYSDYISDLPKPGLTGLYSDNGQKSPTWMVHNRPVSYGLDSDSEEIGESSGYSTIDPRRGNPRVPVKKRTQKRPTKQKTQALEQIKFVKISYIARPDFKLFEGYKLPIVIKTNQ